MIYYSAIVFLQSLFSNKKDHIIMLLQSKGDLFFISANSKEIWEKTWFSKFKNEKIVKVKFFTIYRT